MFSTCPQEHYFDCPYQLSSETSGQTYLDALVSHLLCNDSFSHSKSPAIWKIVVHLICETGTFW